MICAKGKNIFEKKNAERHFYVAPCKAETLSVPSFVLPFPRYRHENFRYTSVSFYDFKKLILSSVQNAVHA
jgi:hypothetical protein